MAGSVRVRRLCACRSAGKLYVLLRCDAPGAGEPVVTCRSQGRALPVACHALDDRSVREQGLDPACAHLVLVLPFFRGRVADVSLAFPGGGSASLRVRYDVAALESVVAYRRRPALCAAIRDIEQGFVRNRYQLSFTHGYQGAPDDVWRLRIDWQGDEGARPEFSVLDADGGRLDAAIHVFEFQPSARRASGEVVSSLYVSLSVNGSTRHFVVVARDPGGRVAEGFAALDGRFAADLRAISDDYMRDACADDAAWRSWFARHRASAGELASQRAAARADDPLVSVVVPCFRSDARFLSEAVASVVGQSYERWELLLVDATPEDGVVSAVVAAAGDARVRRLTHTGPTDIVSNTNAGIAATRGELVAFLDHDDVLEPDALFRYAAALREDDGVDVLYCDEDHLGQDGLLAEPVIKSALDVDLLYSHNCVTHFLAVRSSLLGLIGPSPVDVAGAQDYDLTLRALAAGATFRHVPRVLYHWRRHPGSTSGDSAESKPYALEAGRLALERHLASRGIEARVEHGAEPFVYRVRYALPDPRPLVSVVIPSRDHADLLEACVASFLDRSTYERLEFVVVDNNSVEEATFACYERLRERAGGRLRVVTWEGEGFNYPSLVNFGVERSRGEYVLLLNNDTALISPDAVEEMLGYLQRPEVGVVGAKLYFRDGLVQHAGMIVGPHQTCAHVNQNFTRERGGYRGRAVRPSDFSAVTGACQMVRRSVFDEVGGYDEAFAVGFNDVDFCLRVRRAGYLVVCTPYAELYHYEFSSRGRELADEAKMRRWRREQGLFMQRWPELFVDGDPYGNPAFDPDSTYFALGD